MARTAKPAPKAKITFGEFEPEAVENPWTEHVAELAERSSQNPNASITIEVDVADAQSAQFKFQRAANDIGKTARLRHRNDENVTVTGTDSDGDDVLAGNVALTFTLTGRHKGRRGPRKDAVTETAAE